MTTLLVILHVIFCFTLILVILLQAGRGQGLTGPAFGSGNVQSLFGTRAGDFLTKATSVAAICFLLTCISLDYIEAQKSRSLLAGPRRQTEQIDIEKVKKALEKIKQEAPAAAGGEAQEVSQASDAATQDAAQAVKDASQPAPAAATPEQGASTEPSQPIQPDAT